ncbi:arylsulfatase [Roseibacillus persicicus]|uniref:N-acetylgalactosamine-6-sulfatase n=1 Tax=Roseibacillus persicicus TaxID=454148 RepID=A0A918TGA2_9BACT|nr:arylsulfatase [Roseibacillus persicicus]MDQ8190334.1 arylsulfatase [Roseibacillus persicicus]GHC46718.1 N-acetylgalactosamine-6-sulfatase [Roseibacillus persicicus]
MKTQFLILFLSLITSLANGAEKPNIVYLMLDEWGYYEWSGAGHPILETPNFDRVASEGMHFTQMLAGGNVCAPTRCSLMTGKHNGHATVRSNGGGSALCEGEVTIASLLKDQGYVTGGFGKWGLGDVGTTGVPEKHGFDTFYGYYHQVHAHTYYPRYLVRNSEKIPLEGNTGSYFEGETFAQDLIYEESIKFIREHKDEPFFAYLAWTPPHGIWGMPEDEPAFQKYKDADWGATHQRGEKDSQMYAAMVEMVDRQLGDILALLEKLGLDDNTLVVVSGDNGGQPYFKNEKLPFGAFGPNLSPKTKEYFRGGKGNFYEGGLRVPFFIRWPGQIEPGSVTDYLGYFPDMMPTLAEIAGTKAPEDSDGISIVPTLLGKGEQAQHKYLYWEDNRSRAVRYGNWKAIKPAKNKPYELYDLSKDISEKNDVADKHPEILATMTQFAEEASGPKRAGKVLDPKVGFKGHKAD